MCVLRSGNVAVCLLEVLIPSVLEGSLSRIPEEGRTPACEDTAEAFLAVDELPALHVTLVQLRVYLTPRLDKI